MVPWYLKALPDLERDAAGGEQRKRDRRALAR